MPAETRKWLKYNIERNKYMDPQKYPIAKPQLIAHSSTVDTKNKQIYILDGKNQLFLIMDAKNADNPWTIYKDFHKKCGLYPIVRYVPDPFNEFHVIALNEHLIWDKNNNDFVEICKLKKNLQHCALIYIPSKKQLVLMGGISDKEYVDCIYIATHVNEQWHWNKSNIQLPHKMAKFGHILYEDKYIILFGGEISENTFLNTIYVLDVDICQWIPVDQTCPEKDIYFAVQNGNNIHLFDRSHHHKQWMIDINKFRLEQFEEKKEKHTEVNDFLNLQNLQCKLQLAENRVESQIQTIAELQKQLLHLQNVLKKEKNEKKLYRQQTEQEQKQLIHQNETLKEQNRKLRAKFIQRTIYSEWSTEDLIFWILSLENGRFLQYKDRFNNQLRNSKTEGKDLSNVVNEYTIKIWGVTDIQDQHSLLTHIQRLCQENKNVNMNQVQYSDDVEGINVLQTDQ
eukprot:452441_1